MSSYLPNDAFYELENKNKVVWNEILFNTSFGWGKMDEVCESYEWSKFS